MTSLEKLKKEIEEYCIQYPDYEEEFIDLYDLAAMEVELGSSPVLEYHLAHSDIDALLLMIKQGPNN